MARRSSTRPSATAADAARRLSELAASAGSPAEVYDAAAEEMLGLDGVAEVHIQRLNAALEPGFAVAYAGAGAARRRVYASSLGTNAAVQRALTARDAVAVVDCDDLPADLAGALPPGPALLARIGPAHAPHALAVLSVAPQEARGDLVDALQALAAVTGAAVAAVAGRLESSTDPHTGCLNETAMAARLDEEINRARRHQTPLTCLLLALDDLDSIQRRYGPVLAEQTLAHVGAVLRREFRRFDRVAYLGRGEFAILLPGATGAQAEVVARRAARRLHAIKLDEDGQRRPLRTSLGLGEWREPLDAWDLVASARAAMLRAGQRQPDDGEAPIAAAII